MRHKMAFSIVTGVIVVSMAVMTALAANDETRSHGVFQTKLLGNLSIVGAGNPKNVNLASATGSVLRVPLAGKIPAYWGQRCDLAARDKNGTHGASFLPSDSGIDPLIAG